MRFPLALLICVACLFACHSPSSKKKGVEDPNAPPGLVLNSTNKLELVSGVSGGSGICKKANGEPVSYDPTNDVSYRVLNGLIDQVKEEGCAPKTVTLSHALSDESTAKLQAALNHLTIRATTDEGGCFSDGSYAGIRQISSNGITKMLYFREDSDGILCAGDWLTDSTYEEVTEHFKQAFEE